LILKKDHISLFKRIQNLIHELSGYAAVGSPVKKDAVLAVPVHLDDGMAAGPVARANKSRIDAVLSAGVKKDSAFVSDHSGMINRNACLRKGNGLVQTFSSAEDLPAYRRLSLSGNQ